MKKTTQHGIQLRAFSRRDFLSTSLKAGTAAFTTNLFPKLGARAEGQYNVLFIIADDLRPLLGCYGHPQMHTPNIDTLAQRGTLFNRAYCQYPLCSPSRTSMITGLRPETTGVQNNSADFRQKLPDVVTLPQHFKTHGYHTQSVGRVFHLPTLQDDKNSWSSPSWRPAWVPYDKETTPSWQALDAEDDELRDGKAAKRAVEVLKEIHNTQFFLALGFYKPHLPLQAPKKYYELYKDANFSLPASSDPPDAVPAIASGWSEPIREFQDIPDSGPLPDEKMLEVIQAYAASVSYIDAQIGRVLSQLDALNLTERTVIVFAGDHGFHLGEHGKWRKKTLFEASLHSPLIISVPGQTHQDVKTDALVELVDIYPTLCDTCRLPTPSQLEGLNLMPVIRQPTRPWKTATFSKLNSGRSMRTAQYRYTEWGNDGRLGRELYDYYSDPDETANIANLPENEKLVADLSQQLHAGWRAALPELSRQIHPSKTLPWDINNDGVVDNYDLILVAENYDRKNPTHPKTDVNKDGQVDITDLLLVASHFGESVNPEAPAADFKIPPEHLNLVEGWLTEARLADDGSDVFQQGIAVLEQLINASSLTETTLLPNYPNPFNPETWIPYDLAEDAEVHIHIHNLKGESIRELSLGFQPAGTYRTQTRAAHWDGRNSMGEPVASGIYFYTFQAGSFKAIRQMVIIK